MTTRKYSSRSQQTTLTSAVTSGALTIPVVNALTLLGGATVSTGQTFVVVVDPDTALEEVVEITAVSSNNLIVTRAVDMSGAAAQDHSAGAVIRHMIIGRDLRESNLHIEASAAYNDGTGTHAMHGLGSSDGVVVGTDATQTLTNKTFASPTITGTPGIDTSIVFEGATADAFETTLTVVDPTADRTITLPNATGTVVLKDTVDTLTNKTLTSPTISGSPVITGLSSTGMSASSAAPKDYVDSILGSATAASISAASAATSASSAATSATSAATSASLALTSATNAGALATAATTSAASAATSATAAATSVTLAATQATAAATSATSAAASVTTAAASVASIATYASNALASQNAASTSASSAATSASSAAASASSMTSSVAAAATSATSAAASATTASNSASTATTQAAAAVISAASAATSATAAAMSATSAAASVSAVATSAASALTSQTAAATSATSAAASQTAAATSASSAATSASSAATSASDAATTYDNFDDRYLGAKSSPPTLDNDGNALMVGALYWNSVSAAMFAWTGSAWGSISSTAAIFRYKFIATGGETSVSGVDANGLTLSYLTGKEQVYLNGVLLVRTTDYTATTGTSITGLAALTVNDIVEIITFTAFDVATSIANSTFTAKGDLLVATSASTPGKVAVGTNGQYLQADSTTATGLKWSTVAGYSAPTLGSTVINSGATVTTISGLTDIVLNGAGSVQDELTLILMGAL